MPLLFSYGTLRDPAVQRANFGRTPAARPDRIVGFRLAALEITDPAVIAVSGRTHHPVLLATGDPADTVDGAALEVTDDDLLRADDYEVDGYHRVEAPLASGATAWVYVGSEILAGGGVNEVVRVGNRVRRPTGPWSPHVHDLLRHLAAVGFREAPRVHRVTPDGFEVLDFLPGEVSNYPATPAAASAEALVSAAELLRRYHDATAEYAATAPRTGWQVPAREPVEVICHGDFAPHNCVLDGNRVAGLIDFDFAHPGPRLWDVAYAAYRWVPMTVPGHLDGFGTTAEQAVRLRVFCDSYGLAAADRAGLVDAVVARLTALVDFMHAAAAAGHAAFAGHIEAGHDEFYRGDIAYVLAQRAVFDVA
ncbi:hypothetical protein GCM10010172_39030 [Paractinoplanes ferrugineus]|uniref:Aminoglycoside phosphotransferase n=1 Tax=Paractinoplanes ferrugineus TaxID=113564 RepID=A0A919MFF2_9ACTN|nr:phosphotransferase [Actinoplanes ferrugineus]GIE12679.1 hypothetical protein Afe05nite_45190 [Actinoplanes ferrugineus]